MDMTRSNRSLDSTPHVVQSLHLVDDDRLTRAIDGKKRLSFVSVDTKSIDILSPFSGDVYCVQ